MKFISRANYGPALALAGWFCFNIHDALSKSVMNPQNYAAVVTTVQIAVALFMLSALAHRGQLAQFGNHSWLRPVFGLIYAVIGISFFYAIPRMPFAELFVFVLMRPALGVLMSWIFLKEHLTPRQWIGFAVAILAVLVDLQIWHVDLAHLFRYPPDVLLAIGIHVVGGASAPLLVRRFGPKENTLVLTVYGAVLTVLLLPLFFPVAVAGFTPADWLRMILAAGAFSIGMLFYLRGFQLGPAGLASGTQYSQMIWTALIGWLAFHEIPGVYTLVGAGLVIVSGALLFGSNRGTVKRS